MMTKYNDVLEKQKVHFEDLSLEQTLKITELSQIHCNVPEHEGLVLMGGMNSNIIQNDVD